MIILLNDYPVKTGKSRILRENRRFSRHFVGFEDKIARENLWRKRRTIEKRRPWWYTGFAAEVPQKREGRFE